MTLNLVRRSTKGAPLTAADHDGNLDKIEDAIEDADPAAAVSAHVAEADPHPQYQTQAESDARYATAAQGTDAREWTASTISQEEAEEGTATTRRAFTAQRLFQAVAAWWSASSAKAKLDGIASGATANSSDATLLDRANHTGTQAASTIAGLGTAATTDATAYATAAQGTLAATAVQPGSLATVATSGAYNDLSGAGHRSGAERRHWR